ncbi:hypothetical protein LR48_Vigan02g110500 [Vigna angularis]|uniref:Uncharacterized protein n=2 Tax=Phaseolus angularis TaxID=3914 RepID=A0A0L9TWQ5_PHAAN|nr:uncharacterized protein LOC108324615 [Vigna angularis]KAG2402874.1 uncharacterized protein HKW66_Vig0250940 [Vigna angularis]KOM34955.1 hypothetical protein LR48_Vigan02g110500 [Vigna angularis]BAT95661.1 hypothetical protein VIGAN_08242200 [Vigna angularis var. angularis]
MERKKPLDFSSYFCFEASGDSEEAHPDDPIFACEMTRAYGDDENDDALSCNFEGSGAFDGAVFDEEENECCDDDHDDEIAKVTQDEKSGVYGMSYCEDDDMEEEHMKSHVSFDSGHEFVDEMEKNRLFWEACLAS